MLGIWAAFFQECQQYSCGQDVYHGPITSTYSQVWWTADTNDIPPEIVERFDGKVMAMVGVEMDQVK